MAVGMTNLPQELIDLIASHIQRWEHNNRTIDWDSGASSRDYAASLRYYLTSMAIRSRASDFS